MLRPLTRLLLLILWKPRHHCRGFRIVESAVIAFINQYDMRYAKLRRKIHLSLNKCWKY